MNIYIFATIVAIALYIFNLFGLEGWYIEYWWYDIFMHLLGGVAIGLLVISAGKLFSRPRIKISIIILSAFIVGLAWEGLELQFDITGYPFGVKEYFMDTTFDLINDMVGSVLAAYSVYLFSRRD